MSANKFLQPSIQQVLVHKVQAPIVRIFGKISAFQLDLRTLLWLVWEGWKTYRELRKLPQPTKDDVNKHNAKALIEINEWFLAHEAPNSPRRKFFEGFLGLVAHKYDWDNFMARRLEKWLEKWFEYAIDGKWMFVGKHPETYWILDEADRNDPRVKRVKELRKALHEGRWAEALDLLSIP